MIKLLLYNASTKQREHKATRAQSTKHKALASIEQRRISRCKG
jgi:hypothetical protein